MQKAAVVDQRPMFRSLPGVDIVLFIALSFIGIGSCVLFALR
jgi:hypothetical protein